MIVRSTSGRPLARLTAAAAAAALRGWGAAGTNQPDQPLPAVPWQPGPERFSVAVPGSEDPTISLYPAEGRVGVATGDSLRQRLSDPEDGGQNWYFLELYDHMCPHCWYAVPIVNDVAGAYQDASNWRMTSLNCHMRQNSEVCYFLEMISGAVDYPTFLLCPVPEDEEFSADVLPKRAQKLMQQLAQEQQDTFMQLVRCRVRYVPGEQQEDKDKGPFLSAQSLAGWLRDRTAIEAPHPEMLSRGADFVDRRDVGPRSPPGQPGWLKDDKPGEPGVPAFDPGQRWADALHGFVNTLYLGYRAHRHDAAVSAARFLSRSFPVKARELGDLADQLQKEGPWENVKQFKSFIAGWASSNDMKDPSGDEADDYASCDDSNCAMWTLLHVALTSVASRGLSGRPLFSDDSVVGKDRGSFVTVDESKQFVRDYVENFLSCAPCKAQFLDDFDRCQYGNCDIRDPRDLPVWLWRVHNSVSLRVSLQHSTGIDRRWPMYPDCPKCWKDEYVLSGDQSRRLGSPVAARTRPLGNQTAPTPRRLDWGGAGDDLQFSPKDLDAPFETSRVFWHMVRTYVSIQRVAFELNDLSAEEQEEVDRVVEVERAMASGKLASVLQGSSSGGGGRAASPVMLMLLSIAGCIVCVFCALACQVGMIKDRQASRVPVFRDPAGEVAEDRAAGEELGLDHDPAAE